MKKTRQLTDCYQLQSLRLDLIFVMFMNVSACELIVSGKRISDGDKIK